MTVATTEQRDMNRFKLETSDVLSQHDYFRQHIYPRMQEGVHYYVVNGKRSLSKAGSEFLCALYSLSIIFSRDEETLQSFKSADGLVAFVATLKRGEQVVGQGRGCSLLKNNGGDYNKTVKMAQKSAAIDGTLRAVGISAEFSQDLESMPESAIQPSIYMSAAESEASLADDPHYPYEPTASIEESEVTEEPPISERQMEYLRNLVMEHLPDGEEREKYVASMEAMTRTDASQAIKGMLTMAGR